MSSVWSLRNHLGAARPATILYPSGATPALPLNYTLGVPLTRRPPLPAVRVATAMRRPSRAATPTVAPKVAMELPASTALEALQAKDGGIRTTDLSPQATTMSSKVDMDTAILSSRAAPTPLSCLAPATVLPAAVDRALPTTRAA